VLREAGYFRLWHKSAQSQSGGMSAAGGRRRNGIRVAFGFCRVGPGNFTPSLSNRVSGCLRARNAHLAIGPAPKIGDREAFEEGVGLNDFVSLGSARCIGTGHNEGRVGILQR
jgi:hypothetical protein